MMLQAIVFYAVVKLIEIHDDDDDSAEEMKNKKKLNSTNRLKALCKERGFL
jgi:hypothetical protein